MTQPPGQQSGGSPQQYSPDGRWWWDGRQWVPVQPSPQQSPGSPSIRRRRWPWLALGAAILVLAIGAIGSLNNRPATSTGTPAAVAAKPTAAPAATPAPPARNGSCSPQPCANDNYGWIVTVSDLKYDTASGNPFQTPEAGNVYVTLNVSFTNETGQERHANPFEFVLQDGAGVKHRITALSACPDWQPVNLTPGATFGPRCLAFEATAGRPAGLTLVWTPSIIGGGYNIKLG